MSDSAYQKILRQATTLILDYLPWPVLTIAPSLYAAKLLAQGMPGYIMVPLIVGIVATLVGILERIRPEREDYVAFDQAWWIEGAHLLFGVELGYLLAWHTNLFLAHKLRTMMPIPSWPTHWPILLQLGFALVIYEALSYWQHRLFHRIPALWRFHALHHSGEHLNTLKTPRFHAVDIGIATFFGYMPLAFLAIPENVMAQFSVILSVTGVLLHANMRIRTLPGIDFIFCTPATHRRHHSIISSENNCNFGNPIMIFDVLFGTFSHSRQEGPDQVGIENDPVPRHDFLQQVLSPFRKIKP